jgi:hypothetical protein
MKKILVSLVLVLAGASAVNAAGDADIKGSLAKKLLAFMKKDAIFTSELKDGWQSYAANVRCFDPVSTGNKADQRYCTAEQIVIEETDPVVMKAFTDSTDVQAALKDAKLSGDARAEKISAAADTDACISHDRYLVYQGVMASQTQAVGYHSVVAIVSVDTNTCDATLSKAIDTKVVTLP